jgi:hypothetical protein
VSLRPGHFLLYHGRYESGQQLAGSGKAKAWEVALQFVNQCVVRGQQLGPVVETREIRHGLER